MYIDVFVNLEVRRFYHTETPGLDSDEVIIVTTAVSDAAAGRMNLDSLPIFSFDVSNGR